MKKEEKDLLLKDLCARLPYCVIVDDKNELSPAHIYEYFVGAADLPKPYLRPMSSMTDEERKELRKILCWDFAPEDCPIFENDFSVTTFHSYNERKQNEYYDMKTMLSYFEFLNANHFDYRGLIPMGLDLPAPDEMYKFDDYFNS